MTGSGLDRSPHAGMSVGRAARLTCGIVVPVAVEAAFFWQYSTHAATWHWYIHFFAGGTMALVLMGFWTWRNQRPAPFPLVWLLLAHAYAAIPDLLIPEHIPHQHWMDVFVGHVASHYLPGGDVTWLAIFALALAAYLATIQRARAGRLAATAGR